MNGVAETADPPVPESTKPVPPPEAPTSMDTDGDASSSDPPAAASPAAGAAPVSSDSTAATSSTDSVTETNSKPIESSDVAPMKADAAASADAPSSGPSATSDPDTSAATNKTENGAEASSAVASNETDAEKKDSSEPAKSSKAEAADMDEDGDEDGKDDEDDDDDKDNDAPPAPAPVIASPLCPVPFPQKPPPVWPRPMRGLEGPWNFNKIAIQTFNVEQYYRFLAHPEWTLQESIALLTHIATFSTSNDSWIKMLSNPILATRHANVDECQTRFLHIYSLSKLFLMTVHPPNAARMRAIMFAKPKMAKTPKTPKGKKKGRKDDSTPRTGTRSSARLQGKEKARYVFESDVEEDEGSGSSSGEEEVLERIDRVLAVREREVTRAKKKPPPTLELPPASDTADGAVKAEGADAEQAGSTEAAKAEPAHGFAESAKRNLMEKLESVADEAQEKVKEKEREAAAAAERAEKKENESKPTKSGKQEASMDEDDEPLASKPDGEVTSPRRTRRSGLASPSGGGEEMETVRIREFLIKPEAISYRHVEWLEEDAVLEKFGAVAKRKLQGFLAKREQIEAENNDQYGGEPFNPEYCQVDRIISSTTVPEDEEAEGKRPVKFKEMFLVKWQGLSYTQCTWEDASSIDDEMKIAEFRRFHRPPSDWEREHHSQALKMNVGLDESPEKRQNWYAGSKAYKGANKLRDYQVQGVNWLIRNFYQGRNCILADEMGLGKTVQIVAFLEHLRTIEHNRGPFLVVVPLSTINHWKREIEDWTDMNVLVYHDADRGKDTRAFIRNYEFYFPEPGKPPEPNGVTSRPTGVKKDKIMVKFNIMVTTYETVIADVMDLAQLPWQLLVVDEGHRLKNKNARLLETLKLLECERRILMTGTPLQNTIDELWVLLNFLEPSVFTSHSDFQSRFGVLEHAQQVQQLLELIRPYLLRRLKEDVEKSIPAKEETVIDIELTTLQKQYYRAIYEKNRQFLTKGATSASNIPRLVNVEMELRKCCNHPWLVKGVLDREVPDAANEDEYFKLMCASSGKMVLLDKLLPRLKSEGHRVLIFSQMKKMLDILEEYLIHRSYAFERLDGNVTGNERQASIDRFTKKDSNRFVFLLSTRAGGVGLNLASADTVIIFDSDWNPQQDVQAQARAHRIGQRSNVMVYRFITTKTYESEMFNRASKKLGLDHAVLGSLERNLQDDEKEEIDQLLRLGVYGIFNDDDESRKFHEKDIDEILKSNTRIIGIPAATGAPRDLEEESGALTIGEKPKARAPNTISKLTFQSQLSDEHIDVNDPDFWSKLLPLTEDERYSPDRLLTQLTDQSALASEETRGVFFDELSQCVKRTLRARDKGDDVSFDALIQVLIQVANLSKFTSTQRKQADKWLIEAEKRPERRARRTETSEPKYDPEDFTRRKRKPKKNEEGATGRKRGRPKKIRDEEEDGDEEEEPRDESGSEAEIEEEESESEDDDEDEEDDDSDGRRKRKGKKGKATPNKKTPRQKRTPGAKRRTYTKRNPMPAEICMVCGLPKGEDDKDFVTCTGICARVMHVKCAESITVPKASEFFSRKTNKKSTTSAASSNQSSATTDETTPKTESKESASASASADAADGAESDKNDDKNKDKDKDKDGDADEKPDAGDTSTADIEYVPYDSNGDYTCRECASGFHHCFLCNESGYAYRSVKLQIMEAARAARKLAQQSGDDASKQKDSETGDAKETDGEKKEGDAADKADEDAKGEAEAEADGPDAKGSDAKVKIDAPPKRPFIAQLEVCKCSTQRCALFFHIACIGDDPDFTFLKQAKAFKCPAHICRQCNQAKVSNTTYQPGFVQCLRCTTAIHHQCMKTKPMFRLSKRWGLCSTHFKEAKKTPKGRAMLEAATTANAGSGLSLGKLYSKVRVRFESNQVAEVANVLVDSDDDEDENSDDSDAPRDPSFGAKSPKRPNTAPRKKKAAADDSDDEKEKAEPKSSKAKAKKAAADDDEDEATDSDVEKGATASDQSGDDSDAESNAKKKKKPQKKSPGPSRKRVKASATGSPSPSPTPSARGAKSGGAKGRKRKAASDDEEEKEPKEAAPADADGDQDMTAKEEAAEEGAASNAKRQKTASAAASAAAPAASEGEDKAPKKEGEAPATAAQSS